MINKEERLHMIAQVEKTLLLLLTVPNQHLLTVSNTISKHNRLRFPRRHKRTARR